MLPTIELREQKAEARLARTRAQTKKLELEASALESAKTKSTSFFDYIARFGSAATSLIAVAGLITSGTALLTSYQAWKNSDRERLSGLLVKLGSTAESERLYAINAILERDEQPIEVQGSIVDALIKERSFAVKIIAAEKMIGKKYVPSNFPTLKERLAMFNLRYMNEVEDAARKRKTAGSQPENFAKYDDLYKEKVRELEISTDSIVTLSFVGAMVACTSASCPIDLSTMPIKRYSFLRYPYSLNGVRFARAALWGIDFAETVMEDGNFDSAAITVSDFSEASLKRASFQNAVFSVPNPDEHHYTEKDTIQKGRTVFVRADLTDANFTGACLNGADFRGAIGLRANQFQKSSNKGALFDATLSTELESLDTLQREDPKCNL